MTAKIRMFYGGYEDPEGPSDYYLAPVVFPMYVDDPRDAAEIHESAGIGEFDVETGARIIRGEDELEEWANFRFGHYDVWDMEVPRAAVKDDELRSLIYDLVDAIWEPRTEDEQQSCDKLHAAAGEFLAGMRSD